MAKKKTTRTRRYSKKPAKARTTSVKAKAKALVTKAKKPVTKSRLSWFDKLPMKDRHYVEAVVEAMIDDPDAHPYTVAQLLREELGLTIHHKNIAAVIKDLIRNG